VSAASLQGFIKKPVPNRGPRSPSPPSWRPPSAPILSDRKHAFCTPIGNGSPPVIAGCSPTIPKPRKTATSDRPIQWGVTQPSHYNQLEFLTCVPKKPSILSCFIAFVHSCNRSTLWAKGARDTGTDAAGPPVPPEPRAGPRLHPRPPVRAHWPGSLLPRIAPSPLVVKCSGLGQVG